MGRPPQPLFLANTRYRQRRLRDALSLLPVLGVALFAVPLLWPRGGGGGQASVETGLENGPGAGIESGVAVVAGGTSNATALIYIFAVWAGLLLLGGLLSRRLRPDDDDAAADTRGAHPGFAAPTPRAQTPGSPLPSPAFDGRPDPGPADPRSGVAPDAGDRAR